MMNGSFIRALLKLNEHAIPVGLMANASWWAFVMLHPYAVFESSRNFAALAQMLPEEYWGIVFLSVALVQLYGLISQNYRIRVVAAFLATGLWVTVGSAFIMTNWLTTGTGNYFIWGFLSALSMVLVIYEEAR